MKTNLKKKGLLPTAIERPYKAIEAGEADALTGLSNTRCDNYYQQRINVCCDYLKVTFDGKFDISEDRCLSVIKALKLDPNACDQTNGFNGYQNKYVYDESVIISSGGKSTRNSEGEETWLLEMKGSTCRDFEDRQGDWSDLFGVVIQNKGKPTRVDLALDCIDGDISLHEIKEKIVKRMYATKLKRHVMEGGTAILLDSNTPEITVSNDDGFTATFGGRQTKQLCIYNKKAERIAKEYSVTADTWIRYEARFYHEAAVSVIENIYAGLIEDKLQIVASGLIRGLLEFKEESGFNHHNRAKASIWKKWDQLLKDAEKITVVNQARKELTLARKHDWVTSAAGPTLRDIWLSAPEEFFQFIGFIISKATPKLDHSHLASVNYLRKRYSKGEYSLIQAQDTLIKEFNDYSSGSPYLRSMLKNFMPDFKFDEDGEVIND